MSRITAIRLPSPAPAAGDKHMTAPDFAPGHGSGLARSSSGPTRRPWRVMADPAWSVEALLPPRQPSCALRASTGLDGCGSLSVDPTDKGVRRWALGLAEAAAREDAAIARDARTARIEAARSGGWNALPPVPRGVASLGRLLSVLGGGLPRFHGDPRAGRARGACAWRAWRAICGSPWTGLPRRQRSPG